MNSSVQQPRESLGATLLEVMIVVIIMGVLAVTAVPAVTTAQDVSKAGAVGELRRHVEYARSHAIASGSPTGIIVDMSSDQVLLRRISGGQVVELVDGLGDAYPEFNIPQRFNGADLSSVGGGLGIGESLWFEFDGTPHRRSFDGTRLGVLEEAATFTFSDGNAVLVYPVGGMVQ